MTTEAIRSIGLNVRQLRDQRGMTQNELAERADLSRQIVALIERAESNPSVGTLAALARALGVTLAELVDAPRAQAPRVIPPEDFKPLWRGKRGSEGRLVVTSSSGRGVELWLWNIAAGTTYKAAGEPSEEFLLLLEGELELKFGDQAHVVPAKHAVCLPLREPYSLTARGSSAARFVLMYVPA